MPLHITGVHVVVTVGRQLVLHPFKSYWRSPPSFLLNEIVRPRCLHRFLGKKTFENKQLNLPTIESSIRPRYIEHYAVTRDIAEKRARVQSSDTFQIHDV